MYHAVTPFSDWSDGTPLVRVPEYNMTMAPNIFTGQKSSAAQYRDNVIAYNQGITSGSGQIENTRAASEGAARVATISIKPAIAETQSLTPLRMAQAQSTVLRARTQNLKATADVSQQVQEPVKAEAIRALPWVIGGTVALGLVLLIMYRTGKK